MAVHLQNCALIGIAASQKIGEEDALLGPRRIDRNVQWAQAGLGIQYGEFFSLNPQLIVEWRRRDGIGFDIFNRRYESSETATEGLTHDHDVLQGRCGVSFRRPRKRERIVQLCLLESPPPA